MGDYVFFGAYEQDNNTSNGKENVEWLVLEIKDGKALVISKYALDCKQYNTSYTDVTWETSTLRKWLNNDFYNTACSETEKTYLQNPLKANLCYPSVDEYNCATTKDKVFLLSQKDVYNVSYGFVNYPDYTGEMKKAVANRNSFLFL